MAVRNARKRHDSEKVAFAVLAFVLLAVAVLPAAADPSIAQITTGGHVLMIRHALAPGTGDPANFQIGDCSTQRNLDDRGRDQAHRIGQWLHAHGVNSARVFSSQWCRCIETAERLELGPVAQLPALNSFFERPQDRAPNLAALQSFLANQPTDGKLIILVTHQVTIAAVTGASVSSGEGVILRLSAGGKIGVVGRLTIGM